MRRTEHLLAGLLAALSCTGICGTAAAAETLRGDLDGDGAVTAEDAQLMLQAYTDTVAGLANPLTDAQKAAADVDQNGETDITDAQYILQYYVANVITGEGSTWEDLFAAETSDADAAASRLRTYLEAVAAKDYQTVLNVSDMRLTAAAEGKAQTDEELIADMEQNTVALVGYQLTDGEEAGDVLRMYNKQSAETTEKINKLLETEQNEEKRAFYALYLEIMKPIDKLWCINTELREQNSAVADAPVVTTEKPLYVYYRDGKWTVDAGMISAFVRYTEKSRTSSANSQAKSVCNAFNTAAVDLDAKGVDLSGLNGEYYLLNTDFENLPADSGDVLIQLQAAALQYFGEMAKIDNIGLYFVNGECRAAAVCRTYEDDQSKYFGSYPGYSNYEEQPADIQAALAAAIQTYRRTMNNTLHDMILTKELN